MIVEILSLFTTMETYKWVNSIGACFRGSMGQCEKWAEKLVNEEGWVRNGVTLSHPTHRQILTLTHASQ